MLNEKTLVFYVHLLFYALSAGFGCCVGAESKDEGNDSFEIHASGSYWNTIQKQ